jgi:hypothetical protein
LIAKREAEEAEKVELERLRKEAEDRAEEDRKERIRKEGEERARLKYEAEKQAEKERAGKEAKEKAEACHIYVRVGITCAEILAMPMVRLYILLLVHRIMWRMTPYIQTTSQIKDSQCASN